MLACKLEQSQGLLGQRLTWADLPLNHMKVLLRLPVMERGRMDRRTLNTERGEVRRRRYTLLHHREGCHVPRPLQHEGARIVACKPPGDLGSMEAAGGLSSKPPVWCRNATRGFRLLVLKEFTKSKHIL